MRPRNIVIIGFLLALAAGSYHLGYRSAQSPDNELREARARLNQSLHLYEVAKQGEVERLLRDLGMVVLGQTRAYERQFGVPSGTNAFAEQFRHAQSIAAQVESRLVPIDSVLTNLPLKPDVKIELTK
jgi:hypothetical protein